MHDGDKGRNAELPFVPEPGKDRDADHGKHDGQNAIADQLARHLARHRVIAGKCDAGELRRHRIACLFDHRVGRTRAPLFGKRQADLYRPGIAKLL